MWDDVCNIIYSWGHRYYLELGSTVVFFLLVHFVGYPFIVRRHDAQVQQKQQPSTVISTGNISTSGANSPVVIGGTLPDEGSGNNEKPKK